MVKKNRLIDWLTILILTGTISGACFAGTSKLLALILKDQFNAIYLSISAIETNQKVMNVEIKNTQYMVNKIWDKVK